MIFMQNPQDYMAGERKAIADAYNAPPDERPFYLVDLLDRWLFREAASYSRTLTPEQREVARLLWDACNGVGISACSSGAYAKMQRTRRLYISRAARRWMREWKPPLLRKFAEGHKRAKPSR